MAKPKIPRQIWALIVESGGQSQVLKVGRTAGRVQPHATAAAEQLGARHLSGGHGRVWSTTRGVMIRIVRLTEEAHIRHLWNVREGAPHRQEHRC